MADKVRVVYSRDRSLAFVASLAQLYRLAQTDCVLVEYGLNGQAKSAVLRVPLRVARGAMLRRAAVDYSPRTPVDSIIKAKINSENPKPGHVEQDPGSARWRQRVDQADRGAGTLPETTIHFKLGHREATA